MSATHPSLPSSCPSSSCSAALAQLRHPPRAQQRPRRPSRSQPPLLREQVEGTQWTPFWTPHLLPPPHEVMCASSQAHHGCIMLSDKAPSMRCGMFSCGAECFLSRLLQFVEGANPSRGWAHSRGPALYTHGPRRVVLSGLCSARTPHRRRRRHRHSNPSPVPIPVPPPPSPVEARRPLAASSGHSPG